MVVRNSNIGHHAVLTGSLESSGAPVTVFDGVWDGPNQWQPANTQPPQLKNPSPVMNAKGVSPDTHISFVLQDDQEINPNSITVMISDSIGNEWVAILNGAFQMGFSGSITPVNSYLVVIVPNAPFLPGVVVTVTVIVDDITGNNLTFPFSFETDIAALLFSQGIDMYRFLMDPIRQEDHRQGNLFVKRYLQGPQRIWDIISNNIKAIPTLWDNTTIPDDKLKYLKHIVGWTSDLDYITDDLSDDDLRRLIASSGELWKKRGSESTMIDIIQLLTKSRARIWNWFDFRWILGEDGEDTEGTELGEEHEGRDAWLISLSSELLEESVQTGLGAESADGLVVTFDLPGVVESVKNGDVFYIRSGVSNGLSATVFSRDSDTQITLEPPGVPVFGPASWEVINVTNTANDEFRSNIRIGNPDGAVNKTLVRNIINLMRPIGERYEITYLDLLDRFDVGGDTLQWQPVTNTQEASLQTGSGTASSVNGTTVTIDSPGVLLAVSKNDRFYVTSGPQAGNYARIAEKVSPTELVLESGVFTSFSAVDWEIKDVVAYRMLVQDGRAQLLEATLREETYTIVPNAANWEDYVYAARIRGHSDMAGAWWGIQFYRTDEDNYYDIVFDTEGKEMRLRKTVGGTTSTIDTVDLEAAEIPIIPDVYYTIRLNIISEGGTNRIIVFTDGSELMNTTDSTFTHGSVGFFHEANAVIECDEVEVFQLPVDTDTVEINS